MTLRHFILAFLAFACFFAANVSGQHSNPTPDPTPAPTAMIVDDEQEFVEVVDIVDLERKVRELHKRKFHVNQNNITVAGDKVIIFISSDSLNVPEDEGR